MQIAPLDVADDASVQAYWAAGKAADMFGRPYAAYRSLEAQIAALREEASWLEIVPVVASEHDDVLGIAEVLLPRLDNTTVAYLGVFVPPERRRRGVGTALLDFCFDLARDRGRQTVITEVNAPYETPPQSPGWQFLEHHGFAEASLGIHRALALPVATERLAELERDVAAFSSTYRLVSFTDRVPDELVAGYCAMQTAFNALTPLGDLELEPEAWDEARVRAGEARGELMGRRSQATVALDGDGAVVALTEMFTNRHQGAVGWQSGTLVLPEHRGHRLGLAAKVANQRRFQEVFPTVRLVHSWNAESNGPMVAINDTLGFRPVEYSADMQRTI